MELTRRQLVIGALAGGGLAVGYLMRPRSYPLPLEPGRGQTAFDAWLTIGTDGMVTVAVPQLEMGQGITTLLPQIACQELGADWRQIAVQPAPPSAYYANLPLAARWAPLWMPAFAGLADKPGDFITRRWAEDHRFSATAEGLSLAAYEGPVRRAAASARCLLAQAAAAQWDVDWKTCEAKDGFIVNGKKRLSFGELAEAAVSYDAPDPLPLRPNVAREVVSPDDSAPPTPFRRLDLPAKVDGSFTFGGDVRLPGMVYAAIRHAPIGEGKLSGYDAKAAEGANDIVGVVKGERWLAAVAENWWAAEQALIAMDAHFTVKGPVDSTRIDAALDKGIRTGKAKRIFEAGDPDKVLAKDYSLSHRYDVGPALHATLETATATARLRNGRLELWLATQAPEQAREAVADALGIAPQSIVLYPMPAGGSFDRRLENDHAVEAALIARQIGKPVQLIWSRWQEHVAGWPRTPVSAFMAARTGEGGAVLGWKARLAMPATTHEFGRRLFNGQSPWGAMADSAGEYDVMAMDGAVPPYDIQHVAIEQVPVSIGLPTARLRGNAHGYTAFFTECFIDELAAKASREPLSFRMAMLGKDPRLAECLLRVAGMVNWNGGGDGSGQGIACHVIGGPKGGRIAVIATARRDESGVRVDKISAVADIGRITNLDIARQQLEGGLVFGVSIALGSSTEYVNGLPIHGRLGALDLPVLADCPEIVVRFVDSAADPCDAGELGVAVAPPAIANALFSATGLRFRKLPLLSEEL